MDMFGTNNNIILTIIGPVFSKLLSKVSWFCDQEKQQQEQPQQQFSSCDSIEIKLVDIPKLYEQKWKQF